MSGYGVATFICWHGFFLNFVCSCFVLLLAGKHIGGGQGAVLDCKCFCFMYFGKGARAVAYRHTGKHVGSVMNNCIFDELCLCYCMLFTACVAIVVTGAVTTCFFLSLVSTILP